MKAEDHKIIKINGKILIILSFIVYYFTILVILCINNTQIEQFLIIELKIIFKYVLLSFRMKFFAPKYSFTMEFYQLF